ncbi:MAG: hypothetical protein EOO24_03035 [Comamonadaceae bacterium]|nr:MAG: hypothetical protein EOO24_03035 [Comamonadaceae bacterium]
MTASPSRIHPVRDLTSEPYWQAAQAHRLLIQRCPVTGRHQWYPRAHSLHAPGHAPEWVEASGRGSVFSFTTIHRGNGPRRPPYTCAMVMLEEGVLFVCTLRGIEADRIVIGMPVEVDFEDIDETLTLPYFKPAEAP